MSFLTGFNVQLSRRFIHRKSTFNLFAAFPNSFQRPRISNPNVKPFNSHSQWFLCLITFIDVEFRDTARYGDNLRASEEPVRAPESRGLRERCKGLKGRLGALWGSGGGGCGEYFFCKERREDMENKYNRGQIRSRLEYLPKEHLLSDYSYSCIALLDQQTQALK